MRNIARSLYGHILWNSLETELLRMETPSKLPEDTTELALNCSVAKCILPPSSSTMLLEPPLADCNGGAA